MSSNRSIQPTIRQYLLGQLTGDNLEQFEQQLFADDNLFEEILVAEDELIEESLAGELNQNESDLFARSFLNTPEREQKLLFRQVLKGYAEKKTEPKPVLHRRWALWPAMTHSLRPALASATVVIIVALVGLVPLIRYWMQPPTFATIDLAMSSSERAAGVEATKVKLPLGVDELRLRLALPASPAPTNSYRVELLRLGDRTRDLRTVAQDEKSVVVAIPASQLEPGQYALKLYATKPGGAEQRIPGSYYLTVE